MEPMTMTARTPLQQLLMERAGDAVADGQVLDELETLAVTRGRQFMQGALEGALQRQVDDLEKKLRSVASADAAKGGVTKGRRHARS